MSLAFIRRLWVFLGGQAFGHACVQVLSHFKGILRRLEREKHRVASSRLTFPP